MTEQSPVADFSTALSNFDTLIQAQKENPRAKWKELRALREKSLEQILEQQGLGVCSRTYSHEDPIAWLRINKEESGKLNIDIIELKKLEPQELGILPKDKLHLHFRRYTHRAYNGNPWLEGEYQDDLLELLCPQHFPKETNRSHRSYAEKHRRQGENDIESEVIEDSGKLITKVDSVDVSMIPVKKRYSEMIYRYFDLPALPPEPKW